MLSDVQRTARHAARPHGEPQQLEHTCRLIEERIRRDHRRDRRSRRATEAGAERDPLVDLHLEAELEPERADHRRARRARRCCAPDRAADRLRRRSTRCITTPRAARRTAVTRSPSASTAKPRMSKPMATLPTEAGAKAVARRAAPSLKGASPGRRPGAADPQTRRRR